MDCRGRGRGERSGKVLSSRVTLPCRAQQTLRNARAVLAVVPLLLLRLGVLSLGREELLPCRTEIFTFEHFKGIFCPTIVPFCKM